MESQRIRVRELRRNIYKHEALKCHGYCPGERTLTDDWSFWHGHEDMTEGKMFGKSAVMSSAKHGQGCGGSLEWITVLRERRSRMNRRIAERKTAWQAKNDTNREAQKETQSVESCAKAYACKQHISRKFLPNRRHR